MKRQAIGALALLVAACSAGAAEQIVPVEVRDGRAVPQGRTMKVKRGDDVVLRWHSDRPIVLHLHGYDIELTVQAAVPTDMKLKAEAAGRFPITEHGKGSAHHRSVAYLEVHP